MHVFVNAGNVTAMGPRMLVERLLPSMMAQAQDCRFSMVLPTDGYEQLSAMERVAIERRPARGGWRNDVERVRELLGRTAEQARRGGANVGLTLGDVAPVLPMPHVVFVHNALYAYGEAELPPTTAPRRWRLRVQRQLFARGVRAAQAIVVQTPVMADRLVRTWRVDPATVHVIGQPAPGRRGTAVDSAAVRRVSSDARPHRLLFLAAYYPHKNHALLPALCAELRRRGRADEFRIYLTLPKEHPAVARLVDACGGVVENLGPVRSDEVDALLGVSSALFLPTLIESYGLVYLEAMQAGAPILTSDREFARFLCGDAAAYFDPTDAASVAEVVMSLRSRPPGPEARERLRRRLLDLPHGWDEVANDFLNILRRVHD